MKAPSLALIILLSSSAGVIAQPAASDAAETVDSPATPLSVLSAQVNEIAASTTLAPEAKSKLIASAIRLAITDAIKQVKSSERILEIASQFVQEAAKAAPDYVDAILAGSMKVPNVARIDGADLALQSAAQTGADLAAEAQTESRPRNRPATPPSQFGGNVVGRITSDSE